MITFQGKQVIVTGVDGINNRAQIHYAEALGKTARVAISVLRSDAIDELETALSEASEVPEHPADLCARVGMTLD